MKLVDMMKSVPFEEDVYAAIVSGGKYTERKLIDNELIGKYGEYQVEGVWSNELEEIHLEINLDNGVVEEREQLTLKRLIETSIDFEGALGLCVRDKRSKTDITDELLDLTPENIEKYGDLIVQSIWSYEDHCVYATVVLE